MRWLPLIKVLLLPLGLHSCAVGLRFTATLDALAHGATSFEVGLMLACISLVPALCAVQAGRWLDRSGPRPPVRAALLAAFSAGAAALLLPRGAGIFAFAALFPACLAAGFAFMLVNTTTQRMTGDVCPPGGRQTAFTALSLVTASNNLATPVIAGYVIEHVSFSAFYVWCLTAPVLLAVLVASPFMRDVLAKRPRAARGAQASRGSALDFLRDRPMRAVLFASVVISVAWEVGNLLIPVYASGAGLSPSEIGWVLGAFAAATFVVRFVMPLLLRVVKEWHMIAMTLLVSTIAFALFPFFERPLPLMGAAFLLGLGLGASLPNMMSLVYLFAPGNRIGEAIGFRIMLINVGKAAFPVAAGAVGAVIGAGASLFGLALFTAGGFLYTLSAARDVFGRMRELRED